MANAPSSQPEARHAYNAAYWLKNKERLAESNRRWYEAHQEEERAKGRERAARRYQANPEIWQDKNSQRRARIRSGQVEPVNLQEVWVRDGGKCQICGRKVNQGLKFPHPLSRSWDHIVPLSRGGAHTATNLRLTHLRCNNGRGIGNGEVIQLPLV